jgi:hypothetical protein
MSDKELTQKHAGQPTPYKEEYNEQVYKLCLLGAIDREIADFFSVCEATINNWKLKYPQFLESIKKGKMIADANVAESLYNRAVGFEITETKWAQSEGLFCDSRDVTKIIPGDVKACQIWLNNRQPDKFRDKVETVNKTTIVSDTKDMPTDELIKRAEATKIIESSN